MANIEPARMGAIGGAAIAPVSTDGASEHFSAERWTPYSTNILLICILAWAFDVYEQTIVQLITPILIKEWNITPAVIGNITTLSRWIGLVGAIAFPVLADLYGRKPALIASILGYSICTGLTGFANGPMQLMILSAITRVALSGENPVGQVMVSETAPTKWRATALGALVGGYPFGYMLTTLIAKWVVPMWGWRALYWIGILPALMVVWIALSIKESPRFERVSAAMLKDGIWRNFDILAPVRKYPKDMVVAILVNFFYLFTWIGWSAWMPHFLASEKKLGFQVMASYLTIWMLVAIFAYYLCGWLCDLFGRRIVIPAFIIPAAILLVALRYIDDHTTLFWVGLITNFLITGSFGSGLGYCTELFPTEIRGTAVGSAFTIGSIGASAAPAVIGWIATAYSIGASLPLLAFTFLCLVPIFGFIGRDTTRKELTDFVGEKHN